MTPQYVLVNGTDDTPCIINEGSVGCVGTSIFFDIEHCRVRLMIPAPEALVTSERCKAGSYEVAEQHGDNDILFPWSNMDPLTGPKALAMLLKLARGGTWEQKGPVFERVA